MTGSTTGITPGRKNDGGFTLIEMIVALGLLAMVAGLLSGSIYGMRRVLAAVTRVEIAGTVLSAQTYLRSALAQASLPTSTGASGAEPALLGEAASLRFRTSFAPRGQLEGFYSIGLDLEPSASRRSAYDLVIRQTLIRPVPSDGAAAPAIPTQKSRLVKGLQSLSIAYFGAPDEGGEAPRWFETWSAAGKTPRLVRIAITFPPGDERTWPELTLPLQLANDGARCGVRQSC